MGRAWACGVREGLGSGAGAKRSQNKVSHPPVPRPRQLSGILKPAVS